MKKDLLRTLMLPPDSNFKDVRKSYLRYKRKKYYFYSQEELKNIYEQYCKRYQQEYKIFLYERFKLLLKIVFGLCCGLTPLYLTYLEGFANKTQFFSILFCGSIFFCWGWGIEAATMIKFEEINSIPIFGLNIYIILKILIGLPLGVVVVARKLCTLLFKR